MASSMIKVSLAILVLFYINIVDEALYDILWYGPHMVEVFTLLSIYICDDYDLEDEIDEYMNMGLWWSHYVKLMPTFLL